MIKKLNKYDFMFSIAMLAGLILHFACIYSPDHFADETFHPTISLRLINGDSLISDEWHLTQFSSLFLYLPVRMWMAIKGSTEGLILFLRYFYLVIHTLMSCLVYGFFRKSRWYAIAGALVFYTQVPLRFLSPNHHSLLAVFLLLFTLTLVLIYEKDSIFLYLFSGFCFGCCCVNNPFDCILFVLYIILCITYHISFKKLGRKSEDEQKALADKYNLVKRFFGTGAFLKFSSGLLIAVIMSVAFFLATGGKLNQVLQNIPYLLQDSGHDIFSNPLEAFIEKLGLTLQHFNTISLKLPFLLPVFFIALRFDKKRNVRKLLYIAISFLLAVFYIVGITIGAVNNSRCLAISLPLIIISTTCYILTENKNKKLFYCMWFPGLVANIVQYFASDLHLSTMWVMTVSNIAGVFFCGDFIKECKTLPKLKDVCKILIISAICLQLIFHSGIYLINRTVDMKTSSKEETGPYAGLWLNNEQNGNYTAITNDLDIIKSRTDEDDHILIISELSWMYLYIDRPFGTYSAWQPFLELDRLRSYYRMNPDKIPEYIYVGQYFIPTSVSSGHKFNPDRAQNYVNNLSNLFEFNEEQLSSGILLEITGYKK